MPLTDSELVLTWIGYMAQGGDWELDPAGHEAWCELGDMAFKEPHKAWAIIMALVDRNEELGLDLSGDIAAGPFEDLLHGVTDPFEEFFVGSALGYVDILLPHIIYSLLDVHKKKWLDERKQTLNLT